ncbi:proline dehydrogenase, partial [Dipsacomyces acuminosporus]
MLTNVLLAQLKRPQAALHRRVLASVPAARHYKAISSMNARSITSLPKSSPAESGGPLLKPDPNIALRQRSLSELVTLWAVYRICGSQRLVKAAPSILKTFENLHLSWLSNAVVRRSFFSWFCAGEQEGEIVQTLRRLRDSGMGSLIGFSVEADLSDSPSSTLDPAAQRAQVNVKADMFAKEYINSLVMAAKVPGTMAAIKVTGLVDPQVLYRLSQPYTPMRDAF